MTKKLEDLFNLPEKKDETYVPSVPAEHEQVKDLDRSYKEVEEITKSLPEIKELENLDEKELDDLAQKAEQAYDDLMDLGMNVEVRYASRIFEVAGTMMGHAITAKSNKIEKKLKAIDLQLKKYKIDKDTPSSENDVLNGQGFIITDRNELMKKLSQKE
jgi:hypothetical protein